MLPASITNLAMPTRHGCCPCLGAAGGSDSDSSDVDEHDLRKPLVGAVERAAAVGGRVPGGQAQAQPIGGAELLTREMLKQRSKDTLAKPPKKSPGR